MGRRLNDLTPREDLLLLADILAFFQATDKHQGRTMRELQNDPRFAHLHGTDLAKKVYCLVDSRLLWKRGTRFGTVYVTDAAGEEMISRYRAEADSL